MTKDLPLHTVALSLAAACRVIGSKQTEPPPRVLHQLWDHDPPQQIRTLPRHHDLAWTCLMHASTRMAAAVAADPQKALKQALAYGPGALTEALGGWIAARGSEGITIPDVAEGCRMVQNGSQLLKAPLAHKSTALHWLVAERKTP